MSDQMRQRSLRVPTVVHRPKERAGRAGPLLRRALLEARREGVGVQAADGVRRKAVHPVGSLLGVLRDGLEPVSPACQEVPVAEIFQGPICPRGASPALHSAAPVSPARRPLRAPGLRKCRG